MMLLQDILYKVSLRSVKGSTSVGIADLQIDSRKIGPDSAFIAIRGSVSDGHQFIPVGIQKGAVAIICEDIPDNINESVTYIQVEDSGVACGLMAHNFFDQPSEKLLLTGVTGTNGKTTVATILYKLFTALGYHCGLISTVQNYIGEKPYQATHTTPDAISLNSLLNEMVNDGCSHVFMEVSSHAIHQHRIAGLHFAGGIFTNITHDHLDYHKTFNEYIRVKKMFFDDLPASAFAISNLDEKRGQVMLQNTVARKYYYSLLTLADFKGKILENLLTGLVMMVDDQEVHFRMMGEFNAYNLMAVYGAAISLGEDKHEILKCLSVLTGAEGRFQYLISPVDKITGIIDYAHTPDALLNVLQTIKQLKKGDERVITVVGCGGDRDKAKRPVMAETACEHSDKVIFTSDNPRNEDPLQIIAEMEAGLKSASKRKFISIPDRREAIKAAVALARPADILLVAGKGHENYQEIKGERHHFSDKEVLTEMFALLER